MNMIVELITYATSHYVKVFLVSFLVLCVCYPRRQRGIPDGPIRFPFIGNLPFLMGKDVMERFESLRRQYGDVYGIYIGNHLTVVLNGYGAIHEALVKKANVFSMRPRTVFHQMMFRNRGIVFANGLQWKEHRRFAVMALNEFGYKGNDNTIEDRINDEISYFVNRLKSFVGSFDIRQSVNMSVANVIADILFGQRCSYDDPAFVSCLNSVGEAAQLFARTSTLINCFPFLQHLPGDWLGLEHIDRVRQKPKAFLDRQLEMICKTYSDNYIRNVSDLYIKEINFNKISGDSNQFNEIQQLAFTGELLSAGSETTATCIIWIILYLMLYPDIQRKLHECIDAVISKDRVPTLEDRRKLPYVEAVILEGLRISSVAPLSVPHAVHEDVCFRGFSIPKDTTVLVNLHSVLNDPDLWPEPEVFRPDRFLDKHGTVEIPKEFIPFSLGRRSCLGETLARMELFLYIATMLQHFEFTVPRDEPPPSTKGHLGMTYSPRPFLVVAVQR